MADGKTQILKRLEEDSIFSIYKSGDGFVILEEADRYYDFRLTRTELAVLAMALQAIVSGEIELDEYEGPVR